MSKCPRKPKTACGTAVSPPLRRLRKMARQRAAPAAAAPLPDSAEAASLGSEPSADGCTTAAHHPHAEGEEAPELLHPPAPVTTSPPPCAMAVGWVESGTVAKMTCSPSRAIGTDTDYTPAVPVVAPSVVPAPASGGKSVAPRAKAGPKRENRVRVAGSAKGPPGPCQGCRHCGWTPRFCAACGTPVEVAAPPLKGPGRPHTSSGGRGLCRNVPLPVQPTTAEPIREISHAFSSAESQAPQQLTPPRTCCPSPSPAGAKEPDEGAQIILHRRLAAGQWLRLPSAIQQQHLGHALWSTMKTDATLSCHQPAEESANTPEGAGGGAASAAVVAQPRSGSKHTTSYQLFCRAQRSSVAKRIAALHSVPTVSAEEPVQVGTMSRREIALVVEHELESTWARMTAEEKSQYDVEAAQCRTVARLRRNQTQPPDQATRPPPDAP